jgi:hypothetical protein
MDGARGDQMLAFTFFITDVCVLSRMEWSSLFGTCSVGVEMLFTLFFCKVRKKDRIFGGFFLKKNTHTQSRLPPLFFFPIQRTGSGSVWSTTLCNALGLGRVWPLASKRYAPPHLTVTGCFASSVIYLFLAVGCHIARRQVSWPDGHRDFHGAKYTIWWGVGGC